MKKISYWHVFRLVFVVFSLFLIGDVFYRWDGFSYYAPLSEFLPSVALITILWSAFAVIFTLLVWVILKILERLALIFDYKVNINHLVFFMFVFILIALTGWSIKRFTSGATEITLQTKLVLVLSVFSIALIITRLIRSKTEEWMNIIQEHVTPIVWLFGIILICSVPFVIYHAWFKQGADTAVEEISQTTTTGDRPNIILVTFDAMTAKDMSVYGYSLPTTPFISEWAKSAVLFTKVVSASNYTSPTVTSLMTGKRLWTHQLYHPSGINPVKIDSESLPFLLKNNGYYTMAFVANPFASTRKLGTYKDFRVASFVNEFNLKLSLRSKIENILVRLTNNKILLSDWIIKRDFIFGKFILGILERLSEFSVTEFPPEKPFNKLIEVLDKNPHYPYFAWVHLYPPHAPYLPPEPYMGMFDTSPELRTFSSQEKITRNQYFPQEMKPKVDILRRRYDEFIRYCDDQFKDFIGKLGTKDELKNTVVILSADHGESFEHNYLLHGGPYLYDSLTHVPLIIREYGQDGGITINDLVGQIDIPVTILDLAHIKVPSWMEGRSLVPIMHGGKLQPRSLFSMNFERNPSRGHIITKGTIALWDGDYKLIEYIDEKKTELFNLKQDPDELNNIIEKEPEIGRHLMDHLQDVLNNANKKILKGG